MTQSVCIILKKGDVLVGITGNLVVYIEVTCQPILFCKFADNLYICSRPDFCGWTGISTVRGI